MFLETTTKHSLIVSPTSHFQWIHSRNVVDDVQEDNCFLSLIFIERQYFVVQDMLLNARLCSFLNLELHFGCWVSQLPGSLSIHSSNERWYLNKRSCNRIYIYEAPVKEECLQFLLSMKTKRESQGRHRKQNSRWRNLMYERVSLAWQHRRQESLTLGCRDSPFHFFCRSLLQEKRETGILGETSLAKTPLE